MDKEKIELDQEADFTGFSEEKTDQAVDLAPGQWISMGSKTIFSKKQIKAKTD